jgi:glycosyltransferase involved in cell wall biosynthesis
MGAGNEKELKEIQVLIDKYNLQSKVKFLGKVNSSYVPYVLCNAKVLVSLRPPSSQAFYGFPTKIIEYLLSGKPVVTSITGELNKYMIDKENCFITTGSKDNVIETIQLVLADNILANRIGANGRNLVLKEFNAETIAQTFVKQCIQNKH